MPSDSPNKETSTIVEMVERQANLKPIWEYDWKTESVRQFPRTPMAISWYGIVLAMGCYPIVMGAIAVAFGIFTHGMIPLSTDCLLYTSPSPRDQRGSRMPSSA